MSKEAYMLRALKVICKTMAIERDGGEGVNISMGPGWFEQMKYDLVDRVIENVEPGFDGGETTDEEVENSLADYERLVEKYMKDIDTEIKRQSEEKKTKQ